MAILGRKEKSAIAMIDEPKKKPSLKMTGKLLPKAEVKEAVIKPQPKPRIKIVTAVSNTEEQEILAMLEKDPSKAVEMFRAKNAKDEAKRKERNRFMALSPREKEREAEVKEKTKEAIKSLTTNLDKLDVNPNWKHSVIWDHIAKMCFESSLEGGVLWLTSSTGGLQFKIQADTINMPYKELDPVALKLIKWSGIKLNSQDFDGLELSKALGNAASSYHIAQMKLKSSTYYLETLVARSVEAKLSYAKESATRTEILEALSLATAEVGISLGFYRDKNKNVWINCSDSKYGSTEVTKKVLLPYMQRIIYGSSVAGRLNSNEDAGKLLSGFTNLITN